MSFNANVDADTVSSVNPTAVTVIVAPSNGFGGPGGGVGVGVGVGAGATAVGAGAVVPLPHADVISISSRMVQNLRLLQSFSRRVSGPASILTLPQCGNDFQRPIVAAALRSGKNLSNSRCDIMNVSRCEASF